MAKVDRLLRNHFLARSNDDMMEIRTVAVIDDRVAVVCYSAPFASPFARVLASVTYRESRIDKITEDHRILLDLVFAKESRIALHQRRNDAQS